MGMRLQQQYAGSDGKHEAFCLHGGALTLDRSSCSISASAPADHRRIGDTIRDRNSRPYRQGGARAGHSSWLTHQRDLLQSA